MKRVFRKKPVQIEAMQISEALSDEIHHWSKGYVYASPVCEPTENNPSGHYWQINTLEGVMTAVSGDWIIKGVKGEFYPCKPDIFAMTYEPVEDLPQQPEKNCGNCKHDETNNEACIECGAGYTHWQPKAEPCESCPIPGGRNCSEESCKDYSKEPQGWEQRFDDFIPRLDAVIYSDIKTFIRAEIEAAEKRVRDEYVPLEYAIGRAFDEADFLVYDRARRTRTIFEPIREVLAEIKKRREDGK